jgi:hypothetical protein
MSQIVTVVFLVNHAPFNAGEAAGYEPTVAKQLVDAGKARYKSPPAAAASGDAAASAPASAVAVGEPPAAPQPASAPPVDSPPQQPAHGRRRGR